jgi:hypothetical protein
MIRGISRVIHAQDALQGRFYVELHYSGEPILFQYLVTVDPRTRVEIKMALIFTVGGKPSLSLSEFESNGPLAEMRDVHIRVDASSLSGNHSRNTIENSLFFIKGDEAYVAAPTGYRGWRVVNITAGGLATSSSLINWLSFSRWQLVIDEDGQEIPIVEFGKEI